MRTDEQRDYCIDVLLTRVKTLEAEVARLKGEPQRKPAPPATTGPEVVATGVTPPREQPVKPVPPAAGGASLETAIGTRWIGRIGVLAILFGVAFFLKYSFDNKLIGETGRVILGIVGGVAFIGAGEYLQKEKNLTLYGQMLSGGGLGVLYLSLYAAFSLYHLLPVPLAAAGMLAVTTTGMTLSIRYSAYALAALALFGGFLTPLMLSTGQNQPVSLFSYLLLLDAGTLVLLRFRRWPSLVVASLTGTALMYAAWHAEFFSDAQKWLAFGIVCTFFVFYNAFVIFSRIREDHPEAQPELAVVFGSAAFFLLAFYAQHQGLHSWPVKIFTLALAAVEIALAEGVRRSARRAPLTVASYTAASMILTVVATMVALEQRWLLPALAAEMAALGWLGLRLNLPAVRRGAYLVGLLALIRFVADITLYLEPFERFIPVLNGRFIGCAVAIACSYLFMRCVWLHREKLEPNERYLLETLFIITQVLSVTLLSVEVHDFFRFRSPGHVLGWGESNYGYQLSLSVLWSVYASLLIAVGIFRRLRGARIAGIALLGVTILKVFLVDLSELQTFYRIISFIVLGLLLLAVSYGYNRFRHLIFGGEEA